MTSERFLPRSGGKTTRSRDRPQWQLVSSLYRDESSSYLFSIQLGSPASRDKDVKVMVRLKNRSYRQSFTEKWMGTGNPIGSET
jgi:hypothetical protein